MPGRRLRRIPQVTSTLGPGDGPAGPLCSCLRGAVLVAAVRKAMLDDSKSRLSMLLMHS